MTNQTILVAMGILVFLVPAIMYLARKRKPKPDPDMFREANIKQLRCLEKYQSHLIDEYQRASLHHPAIGPVLPLKTLTENMDKVFEMIQKLRDEIGPEPHEYKDYGTSPDVPFMANHISYSVENPDTGKLTVVHRDPIPDLIPEAQENCHHPSIVRENNLVPAHCAICGKWNPWESKEHSNEPWNSEWRELDAKDYSILFPPESRN